MIIAVICMFCFSLGCDSGEPDDNGTTTTTAVIAAAGCGCDPLPPAEGPVVTVGTVEELRAAVEQANAAGGLTVLLQDGTYTLNEMLWISGDDVTVRSASGECDAVIIRGQGMDGTVGYIFNVAGDRFTAADMTLGWVANHAVQIHGEEDADNPYLYNLRFVDTNEQMLKISYAPGSAIRSDGGIVACCTFEYSAGMGPQYYIGGVDCHRCRDWIVRSCTFRGIRSPEEDLAEFAIHFWSDAEGTAVENNRIVDCDRGIGFGLGDRGHIGGMIRNNMVCTTRDAGIALENARDASVYNNTVFTENYGNSIEYRFSGSTGISIVNNLTSMAIAERDGASAELANNCTGATATLFVDAQSGDLHLAEPAGDIVDRGAALTDVVMDYDCEERPRGGGYDIGADEY